MKHIMAAILNGKHIIKTYPRWSLSQIYKDIVEMRKNDKELNGYKAVEMPVYDEIEESELYLIWHKEATKEYHKNGKKAYDIFMRNHIPDLILNGKKYYYDINENYSKQLDIERLLINLKGSIILAVKKGLDSKEGMFGVINTGADTFTVKIKEEKKRYLFIAYTYDDKSLEFMKDKYKTRGWADTIEEVKSFCIGSYIYNELELDVDDALLILAK